MYATVSTDLSMNVLIKGLVTPSSVNLAMSMAVKTDAGIPNALSNIWTVKGATLVPAGTTNEANFFLCKATRKTFDNLRLGGRLRMSGEAILCKYAYCNSKLM